MASFHRPDQNITQIYNCTLLRFIYDSAANVLESFEENR